MDTGAGAQGWDAEKQTQIRNDFCYTVFLDQLVLLPVGCLKGLTLPTWLGFTFWGQTIHNTLGCQRVWAPDRKGLRFCSYRSYSNFPFF